MYITPKTIEIDGNKNNATQAGSKYRKDINYYKGHGQKFIYQKIIIALLIVVAAFALIAILILIINMMNISDIQDDIRDIGYKIDYT